MTAALHLPDVTLVCVDTRLPALALEAITRCRDHVLFGDAVHFTDPAHLSAAPTARLGLRVVPATIDTAAAYSQFMLRGLLPHVHTSHALVVQWDGWLLDATRWEQDFLRWDYIGAPWHGEPPERAVGNGGFSLRSRRLLQALQEGSFAFRHPEDICLCHDHRTRLERDHAIRFAPLDVAARFSYERVAPPAPTFGFHGLFNLASVLAPPELEALLRRLPDEMARGLDAHDLARDLIALGRLGSAAVIVSMRKRLGMHDRRTLRLRWQLALARRRRAA